MPHVLVCYGTGEGQTRKVARRIGTVLESEGHDVELVDVDRAPSDFDPAAYDAVVVGVAVRRGRHQAAVQRCVHRNRGALAEVPSAFFQVSLASAVSDAAHQERAGRLAEGFLESTGWDPDRVALFAGALHYSMYGFVRTLLAKWWARRTTGDVDTDYDYEYTDWDAVEAFAADVAALLAAADDAEIVADGRREGEQWGSFLEAGQHA